MNNKLPDKAKRIDTTNVLTNGRFKVYLHNNIVYKKIILEKYNKFAKTFREKMKLDFINYKKIIKIAHKYEWNHTIPAFDIESNGNYKSVYIAGPRLDKVGGYLNKIKNKNYAIKMASQIKKAVMKLKKSINLHSDKITGDWALHNLIYSVKYDKVFNVDIEGFFTYQKLPDWGQISDINRWLDQVIRVLP
jgi:hypothetical protein